MIYFVTPGYAAGSPVATPAAEHAVTSRVYQSVAATGPPVEINLVGYEGEQAEIRSQVRDVIEAFDWSDSKVMKEYVRLEQKVLAKKASPDEFKRHRSMKRDRNSQIFADRYVRDYAEVQRLKRLSEKLVEIQHYLRPIEF